MVPFLTFYLIDERGLSIGDAGAIVSLFGAGGMVAALVGGVLADRLGRRGRDLDGGRDRHRSHQRIRGRTALRAQTRGRYQGLFTMSWGLAAFAGPLIGPRVLEEAGPAALWAGCLAIGVIAAMGFATTRPERDVDARREPRRS